MENTKAKNIIITVLGILLVAVICFVVYYIIIVNKNNIKQEEQVLNISKLQENIIYKEKEIDELKKSNEELKKQVEELKKEDTTTSTKITLNKEPIDLLGKTLGDAKKKYGVSGKSNVYEGQVYIVLKNGWQLMADIENWNYKIDSLKIVSVNGIKFKELFNNFESNYENKDFIISFFGSKNVTIDELNGKILYHILYDIDSKNNLKRGIWFEIDKNEKINANTVCGVYYDWD